MHDNVSFRVNNYSIKDFEEFIDRIGDQLAMEMISLIVSGIIIYVLFIIQIHRL